MIWKTTSRLAVAVTVALAGGAAVAESDCRRISFEDTRFTVCTADPAQQDLRLWLYAADGSILGTFDRVNQQLESEGATLGFAMNAGMFHENRAPVGHYVEDGVAARRVITSAGPGNFGMLPNGVFCIGDGWAQVVESRSYVARPPSCRFATQSGPMLVIDGDLHPRFLPDSTSRFVRNGVGVTAEGLVVAAISDQPVTFHRFGRLFRDGLGAPNALYLDGNVSRLYAPGLGRHDAGFPMGPILGTVVPAD